MRLQGLSLVVCCFLFSTLWACTTPTPSKDDKATKNNTVYKPPGTKSKVVKTKAPKRIILMIGDGMGISAVSGAALARGSALEMLQMPHHTLMRTHEYEYITTDSAASATAFATGHKTHFEGVSVKPGTSREHENHKDNHLSTMVDVAKKAGWKTGLIATSRIVHATPAAFAAHRHHRGSYEDIAMDMSAYGVDVLLGAGSKYFQKRKDGKDLLAEMGQKGYTIASTAQQVRDAKGSAKKLVGLMHEKDMPTMLKGGRAMPLAEMLGVSLDVLDRDNDKGFFLMVEGSQIDWEEHAMEGPGTIKETLDFDAAIGVARAYASKREDTLVIVTADHETGGFTIFDSEDIEGMDSTIGGPEGVTKLTQPPTDPKKYPPATAQVPLGKGALAPKGQTKLSTNFGFLSMASRATYQGKKTFISTHTATMVPLFAQGAGASHIMARVNDNADLGTTLQGLIAQGGAEHEETEFASQQPRNIILVVGSGLGASGWTASYYHHGKMAALQAPHKGFVSTTAYDRLVPDAAAAATALATGKRTKRGALGMIPGADGNLQKTTSVLWAAEDRGKATGLISTTSLTSPTLAAFYAHGDVNSMDTTARKKALVASTKGDGVDVLFSSEPLGFDESVTKQLTKRGTIIGGKAGSLPQMTTAALDVLKEKPQGFFLVIEAGQIARKQAALDTSASVLNEINAMDMAVEQAFAFAKERGDTLVVVTSDRDSSLSMLDNHYGFVKGQCGIAKRCQGTFAFEELSVNVDRVGRNQGLKDSAMQGPTYAPPKILLQYAWLPQAVANQSKKVPEALLGSAHFVPVFAMGPRAAAFSGFRHQAELGALLMQTLAP